MDKARKVYYRLAKTRAQLEQSGTHVTPKVLAQHLNVPVETVQEMDGRMKRADLSLDTAPNAPNPMLDDTGTPEEQMAHAERMHRFEHHLEAFRQKLTGRDRIIFEERMIAETPKTLAQLADILNISRERVRQLEARILDRLRVRVSRSKWQDLR